VARSTKYPVTVIVTLGLIAAAFFIGRSSGPPSASAAPPIASATPVKFTAFYLDIGASESLGFQPTGIVGHNGERTNTGYANDLISREGFKGVSLELDQVGCPGDTVQKILDTTKDDACYHAPQTQMTKAIAYLKSQTGQGLVTVDLGFNNVRPCLEANPVNQACLAAGIAAVTVDLPKIMSQLKAAAGPDVHFVGLEYADPYLGYYLNGAGGPAEATSTLVGMNQLDTVLDHVYTNAGAQVANVPDLFQTNNNAPATISNVGTVPTNVQQACELTWFCFKAPFGPDDHPNDAGYSLIASAIEAVLPKSW
jgi:GDSL-like Lipase/Acylhydrolase family